VRRDAGQWLPAWVDVLMHLLPTIQVVGFIGIFRNLIGRSRLQQITQSARRLLAVISPELMSVATLIRCPIAIALLHFSTRALEAVLSYWTRREILRSHHVERLAGIKKGLSMPPLSCELLNSPPSRHPTHRCRAKCGMWRQ
jgi:hypothetical protein